LTVLHTVCYNVLMDETKQHSPDWHNQDEATAYGDVIAERKANWANEIAEFGEPVRWTVFDERDGLVPVFTTSETYAGEFLFHRGFRVDLSLG